VARGVGEEEVFCKSVVGHTYSAPIHRPLARSNAWDDTSAMATTRTSRFNKAIHSKQGERGH
jgi:hypothetical protein